MAKYLPAAHQTVEREELLGAAKGLAAHDRHAKFTLLVPATPGGDLLTGEEGDTKERLKLERGRRPRRRCNATIQVRV
jgi:hypothetical protein